MPEKDHDPGVNSYPCLHAESSGQGTGCTPWTDGCLGWVRLDRVISIIGPPRVRVT